MSRPDNKRPLQLRSARDRRREREQAQLEQQRLILAAGFLVTMGQALAPHNERIKTAGRELLEVVRKDITRRRG